MSENLKAIFRFEKFFIKEFSFRTAIDEDLGLSFDPKGLYNVETGRFELNFLFKAFEKTAKDNPNIQVNFSAFYKFEEKTPLENIPSYFYRNSIAIAFPYLRAFISNLALQANQGLMILPVMNLSSLEPKLKENTSVISSQEKKLISSGKKEISQKKKEI